MIERAPVTYRDAGVDIDAGDELVERIKPRVKRSMRPEVLGGIGGFGALVEVPLDRYRKPVLVSGTDGVGTKLRLAIDTVLVGAAICAYGIRTTEVMLKEARLNPASARVILSALKRLSRDDLFGSTSAIDRERYLSVEWVREHYKGDRAGSRFMREYYLAAQSPDDFFSRFIYGMNEQRLGADLDRFNKYFDAALAAWRQPDNSVRLTELSLELGEGQFGLVARLMAPSLDRVRRSMDRAQTDIQKTTIALELIIHQDDVSAAGGPAVGRAGKP